MEKSKTHHSSRLDKASKMLKDQHNEAKKLFKQFEQAKDAGEKQTVCTQLYALLKMHTQLENQTYYPTVKDKIKDPSMIDEGVEEHAMADKAIQDLEGMDVSHEDYEGHFTALKEAIEHHIEEEEKELFPMVDKADIDYTQLFNQMEQCWQDLQAQPRQSGRTMPKQ